LWIRRASQILLLTLTEHTSHTLLRHRLPEIKNHFGKSAVKVDCAACGYNGVLATSHKLVTYMLKNPPKKLAESEKDKDDASDDDKEKKKKEKKEKKKDEEEEGGDDDKEKKKKKKKKKEDGEEESGDDEDKEKKKKKKKKKEDENDDEGGDDDKEKKKKKKKKKEDENEDEGDDDSKEKKKKKKKKKEDGEDEADEDDKEKKKKKKKKKEDSEEDADEGDDKEKKKKKKKVATDEKEAPAAASPKPAAAAAAVKDNSSSEDDDNDDDDESNKPAGGGDDDDDDDDDKWHADVTKDAQQRRKEEHAQTVKKETLNPEVVRILNEAKSENKQDSPVTILRVFMAERPRGPQEVKDEVRRLQIARGLDDIKRMQVLLEAILDGARLATLASSVGAHAKLLKMFAPDKGSKGILLGCLERVVGDVDSRLMSRTPIILQALYEAEVLDEATILLWAEVPDSTWLVNKEVASKVRKFAAPFINWLK
jgi:hypothetical protein